MINPKLLKILTGLKKFLDSSTKHFFGVSDADKATEEIKTPQKQTPKVSENKYSFCEYKERIKQLLPEFKEVDIDVDALSEQQIIVIKSSDSGRKIFKDKKIRYIKWFMSKNKSELTFMAIVKITPNTGLSIANEYIILSDINIRNVGTSWDVDLLVFIFVISDRVFEIIFNSGTDRN